MPDYSFRPAPENATADASSLRDIVRVVNTSQQGKMNCTLDYELSTGTSTVIQYENAAGQSWIVPMPLSSAAAGALNGWWIDQQGKRTFRLNHAAGAAGRMVRFAVIA